MFTEDTSGIVKIIPLQKREETLASNQRSHILGDLSLSSWVILGLSLELSEPLYPQLWNETVHPAVSRSLSANQME